MKRFRSVCVTIIAGLLGAVIALTAVHVGSQPITVNNLRLLGTATGTDPALEAYGVDTDIGIRLLAKGAGSLSGTFGRILATASSYSGSASYQALEGDLTLASATPGTSTANQMRYLGGAMGNVIRDGNLTTTNNIVAGVIGKYDLTGTNSSVYPKAGVVGEVGGAKAGQVVSSADGAFVAVLGGDEGPVQARAAYTVDFENTGVHSVGSSYFQYGLDLQGTTHSSYMAPNYQKADIILGGQINGTAAGNDVCVFRKAGAPTNGVSGDGAGNCGPGALLIDTTNAKLYINTNTKASPTWTVVGSQS